jgi:hypothetical protein
LKKKEGTVTKKVKKVAAKAEEKVNGAVEKAEGAVEGKPGKKVCDYSALFSLLGILPRRVYTRSRGLPITSMSCMKQLVCLETNGEIHAFLPRLTSSRLASRLLDVCAQTVDSCRVSAVSQHTVQCPIFKQLDPFDLQLTRLVGRRHRQDARDQGAQAKRHYDKNQKGLKYPTPGAHL